VGRCVGARVHEQPPVYRLDGAGSEPRVSNLVYLT
jgi:hypothetical protein